MFKRGTEIIPYIPIIELSLFLKQTFVNFRPAKNAAKPFKLTKVKFFDGPVSYDIEYTYANMANQKFRIFKNSPLIEHEFALGPIKQGMEVIVRFNTNIKSGDEFYTGKI